MANLITLPALGVALFVAAGTGVYLGESSIGLIKPIYFEGPALHPRDRGAAIDPNRIRPREPAFADHYGWDEGHSALAEDCGDCEALRARDAYAYSAVVPYFGSSEDPRFAGRDRGEEPEPVYREAAPSRASEATASIERYAHYRVSADEESARSDYKSRDVYLAEGESSDSAAGYYDE